MEIKDLGDFLFMGFSIMKNGKIGHFKISNNGQDKTISPVAVPAIHRNPNLAIKEFHENNDGLVVKIEVFKDGSVIILSNTNRVISGRKFNLESIMNTEEITVPHDWVELVAKIGNRTLECSTKTFY